MKPKDKDIQKYSGPRTVDAMVQFVSRKSLPSIQKMECEQLDKILDETRILMAYIGEADNALFSEAFIPYSKEQYKITFVHLEKPCKETITAPAIVLYRTFDTKETLYSGNANLESLKEFA